MRHTGSVKFFNESKGFGFIIPNNGEEDVFVHISQVVNKKPLKENQRVSYDLGKGKKGVMAENVEPC